MESNRLSLDDGIELNDEKTLSGRLDVDDDDDWEVSEKLIGNRRSITYRGSPDSVAAFERNLRLPDGEIFEERILKPNGNHQQILKLIYIQSDPNKSATAFHRKKKEELNVSTKHPREELTSGGDNIKDGKSDVITNHPREELTSGGDNIKDGKSDVITNHPKKEQSTGDDIVIDHHLGKLKERHLEKLEKIFSHRLTDLGVSPREPLMVLDNSAARIWVKPLLMSLLSEECYATVVHDKLNDQSYKAFLMMLVIVAVNIVAFICKPSYFWLCFWFYWICILSIFAYLHWLRYKMKLVMKYRVSIADWAEELRKDLPDWSADCNPRINLFRLFSAQPLGLVDSMILNANLILFFSAAFYLNKLL